MRRLYQACKAIRLVGLSQLQVICPSCGPQCVEVSRLRTPPLQFSLPQRKEMEGAGKRHGVFEPILWFHTERVTRLRVSLHGFFPSRFAEKLFHVVYFEPQIT